MIWTKLGEVYQIEDIKVIPFHGKHKGNVENYSAMYPVELPDGRKLFYGLDSMEYLPETIEALQKVQIDIFISEATDGMRDVPNSNHLSLKGVHKLIEQLYCQGTLHSNSRVYLTHINHGTSHSQMVECTEQMQFPVSATVAWDGLKILGCEETWQKVMPRSLIIFDKMKGFPRIGKPFLMLG